MPLSAQSRWALHLCGTKGRREEMQELNTSKRQLRIGFEDSPSMLFLARVESARSLLPAQIEWNEAGAFDSPPGDELLLGGHLLSL